MGNVTISQSEYIELLRYKEIVRSFEEMLHEPEFKKDFVKRVLSAEKRIKKGEKISLESVDDLDNVLDEK